MNYRYAGSEAARADTGDMVAVHQMFRREIRSLTALVEGASVGDRDRAGQLDAHLRLVLNFLENHHEGEDDLLWPLLEDRAAVDADLLNMMSVHHEELDRLLSAVLARSQGWAANADQQSRDLLVLHLNQLSEILHVHLDAEERFILPLVAQHLTVGEWAQVAAHGAAGTPRRPGPAFMLLGTILDDAGPAERASFWATLPLTARLVWRTVGRRYYSHQRDRLHRPKTTRGPR